MYTADPFTYSLNIVSSPRCKIKCLPGFDAVPMPAHDNSEIATASNRGHPDHPDRSNDDDRYDPQRVETKWFECWQTDPNLYAAEAD
jgi:hypothetical protein